MEVSIRDLSVIIDLAHWIFHRNFIVAEDRQYELHVIFGSPSVTPWKWKVWQQIAAH